MKQIQGKAVHPIIISNEANEKYFKGNAVGERIYEKVEVKQR